MLSKQELDAALAAERAMYRALSEVQDITRELLDAVDRQDQVSVRLFLSMRQEQINQLRDQKELLKKQCGGLPKEEGDLLRQILSGKKPAGVEGEALSLQVERNRALLERTLQADKALSTRLAGRESFNQRSVRPLVGGKKPSAGILPAEGA